jgi:isoquinoline 1-oxidoreductase subunit beta
VPYDFGVVTHTLNEVPLAVPTGIWRSVYFGTFAASNEMMVDQVAKAMRTGAAALECVDEGAHDRRVLGDHRQ